jgi:hypothetical protein
MAKRTTTPNRQDTVAEAKAAMRRSAREAIVADAREGRVLRAATFTDRKREASRKACRGRHWE